MEEYKIIRGKNLDNLKKMPDNSVDSVVTDPPYGYKFMGKKWDYDVPSVELWREVLRVLKPGGHMLAACGTRTQHRMVCNIEDAGFEIRDVITWHYGEGFPKSQNISKAIHKRHGIEEQVSTADEAKKWEGFGTALKPATEFWTLARKPLSEKSVAENILKWGTGGINIDGCRIDAEKGGRPLRQVTELNPNVQYEGNSLIGRRDGSLKTSEAIGSTNEGRFPANLILDEFMAAKMDEQAGILKSGTVGPEGFKGEYRANVYGKYANNQIDPNTVYGDEGGASRFFYVAKPSRKERNAGLRNIKADHMSHDGRKAYIQNPYQRHDSIQQNFHPTVKPIKLMTYLIRLVTPPGGTVLDPYNGSGTTGCACMLERFQYIGMEKEPEYVQISNARIEYWRNHRNCQLELF